MKFLPHLDADFKRSCSNVSGGLAGLGLATCVVRRKPVPIDVCFYGPIRLFSCHHAYRFSGFVLDGKSYINTSRASALSKSDWWGHITYKETKLWVLLHRDRMKYTCSSGSPMLRSFPNLLLKHQLDRLCAAGRALK